GAVVISPGVVHGPWAQVGPPVLVGLRHRPGSQHEVHGGQDLGGAGRAAAGEDLGGDPLGVRGHADLLGAGVAVVAQDGARRVAAVAVVVIGGRAVQRGGVVPVVIVVIAAPTQVASVLPVEGLVGVTH